MKVLHQPKVLARVRGKRTHLHSEGESNLKRMVRNREQGCWLDSCIPWSHGLLRFL